MSRRRPLVTQHLENISREALEQYQPIIYKFIRRRQGVYALYRRGRLYYVGLASNLRSRLRSHLRDKHGVKWDRFSVYLTIGDQHLKELEALILRVVQPKGNAVTGKFMKAENLVRRFRRELHEYHRREEDSLIFGPEVEEDADAGAPRTRLAKNGRTPVLAPYVSKRMVIRGKYKGKWLKARVRRNGLIYFGGKLYTSPSLAGQAACKRVSCNGWKFWTYERSPGDWVLLENLRK
ncbi:MAG: GIY-YIG nuclease family protein [Deltaproteobacteria bacterium]|nr:GIY-YIG nuclease family protein [Deltaproteobacteria bacterium]